MNWQDDVLNFVRTEKNSEKGTKNFNIIQKEISNDKSINCKMNCLKEKIVNQSLRNSENNEIPLQKEKIQNSNNFRKSKELTKSLQSLQKSNINIINDNPTKFAQNSAKTSSPNLKKVENTKNISVDSLIIDDDYKQSVQGITKMRQKYINYPQISYLNVIV